MQYKLIALDIDGTLLTTESKISPRMRGAIGAAQQAGLLVTVATGRRWVTTRPIADELALREPLIIQTGALITEPVTARPLYHNPMPVGAAQEALRIVCGQGLQPIVYENAVLDQHLSTGPQEFDSSGARKYLSGNPELVLRRSYDQLIATQSSAGPPLELAVIDALEPLERTIPLLTVAGCRTIISYSGNLDSYFLEVFGATCSKGDALLRLASWYGLSPDDVVAVGDNYNDVEMLTAAGLGVAMGNAADEIKAYANCVTLSNDEDGAALIIEQILAGDPVGVG